MPQVNDFSWFNLSLIASVSFSTLIISVSLLYSGLTNYKFFKIQHSNFCVLL